MNTKTSKKNDNKAVKIGGVQKPSVNKITGLNEGILEIAELLDVPMFVPSFKPSVIKSAYSS
jgi:hypothetical protein